MISHRWTGYNDVSFELTDGGPISLINEGLRGMGMPEMETLARVTALLDGQKATGWRAKPREVFWPILISGADTSEWHTSQSQFWSTLFPNQYGSWRVTHVDGSYRELSCRIDNDGGGVYENDPSWQNAEVHGIRLIADDPYWQGPAISKSFQTAETSLPFYAITSDRVLNLMSSNTIAGATINNPGDVPAWLVHRFDGPLTAFTIGYSSFDGLPNENVTAPLTLDSGEWAILDTSPNQQTLLKYTSGGAVVDDVTSLLEGASWARVEPGENQPLYVELNGSGSMTSTITPLYFRAF